MTIAVIRVNAAAVQRAFKRLDAGLQNAQPLMRRIAFLLDVAVADNFANGGRPRWLGLAPNRKRPSTLELTGRLRNSIIQWSDARSAIVGTNLVYAAIHQFGGEIRFPPRSGSVRLRTNARGELLRRGNLATFARDSHKRARTVQWTSNTGWVVNMPARPFLQTAEEDNVAMEEEAQRYLRGLLDDG